MKIDRCLSGTPEEVKAARAAADKALGYPRRGTHVGGGIHVAMPATWDGTGACPPGWSATASEPVTAVDGVCYLSVAGLETALRDPVNLAKLTPAEQQSLVGKVNAAQDVNLAAIATAAQEAKEAAALTETVKKNND